jgi:hypothetical protein
VVLLGDENVLHQIADGVHAAIAMRPDANRQDAVAIFPQPREPFASLPSREFHEFNQARANAHRQGVWRSDGTLCRALNKDLDDLWDAKPKKEQKSKKKENNTKDALLAEAAKFDGGTLLTCDGDLAKVAGKHGIKVLRLNFDGSPRLP